MKELLPGFTRRSVLRLGAAAALIPGLKPFAWAQGKDGLHALSVFGEFKYPPGFAHFDYVNPSAPKGGRMHFQPPNWGFNQSTQTFNTLNTFVLQGDAPPRLPLCLTYAEAGRQLGIGEDRVRTLVNAGILDRPEWARTEMSKAVVTTASVARAAGWPVVAIEVAVPAKDAA